MSFTGAMPLALGVGMEGKAGSSAQRSADRAADIVAISENKAIVASIIRRIIYLLSDRVICREYGAIDD
jgi:hypothetical protein